MKDLIKRILIIITSLLIVSLLIYSMASGVTITNSAFKDQNINYYIILILIFLYTAIVHGIYPIHIKINKPALFFIGIALIVIGKTVLDNDGQSGKYFGDLFVVVGVIITLLSPTNTLIPQKIINKKKSKKIEVIEV